MVLVYLKTGECVEIEQAVKAEKHEGMLLCLAEDDSIVERFSTNEVEAYTANPEIAEIILDEVCEDLTVVSSQTE